MKSNNLSYKKIFLDIYCKNKRTILLLTSIALFWSMFLFPCCYYSATADTVINTPSALNIDSFGGSAAVLATSLMETIGVSADPYAVLTFIGIVSRLNDYFEWNLNIHPGLMKNDIIFAMIAIMFLITKISKCFGSTKALSMIHFGEIEKWVGLIFTFLLSSSIFIDFVTQSAPNAYAASTAISMTAGGIFTSIFFTILSFIITLISWIIYYIVKMFFDFLDIISLPLSAIPGATFLYETIKTTGILLVMTAIMLAPVIGLILCTLILITAIFFFRKSYAAMLYFRRIYFKSFLHGIFGYKKILPLTQPKIIKKLQKYFPNSSITLTLPVYNMITLKVPLLKKYVRSFLVCADDKIYLCHLALRKKRSFIIPFSNEVSHPIYIKKSLRFFEIFSTLENENMEQKWNKVRKIYHFVFSKEYINQIEKIYQITGFGEYKPYKNSNSKTQESEEI